MLYITKASGNKLDAKEQYALLKYFADSQMYSFIEWKKNGYHLNTPPGGGVADTTTVVHGSKKEISYRDAQNRLRALGIMEDEIGSCLTRRYGTADENGNSFFVVDFATIDNLLGL